MESIDKWADVGLRTLMLASKNLTVDEYHQWNDEYERVAQSHMLEAEKEQIILEMYAQMETDLKLVGATAIEDKL